MLHTRPHEILRHQREPGQCRTTRSSPRRRKNPQPVAMENKLWYLKHSRLFERASEEMVSYCEHFFVQQNVPAKTQIFGQGESRGFVLTAVAIASWSGWPKSRGCMTSFAWTTLSKATACGGHSRRCPSHTGK